MAFPLLLLPRAEDTEGWLQLAAETLQGYQPHPTVLRRTRTEGSPEHLEVRRLSPEPYLGLGSQLLLHPSGQLFQCRLEAVRHLRRRADSSIEDETYELAAVETPSAEQLDLVRHRCMDLLLSSAYASWDQLDWDQRAELARFGGGLEQANQALSLCAPSERLRTLQLLLGSQSHLLEGGLKAGVEVVPWLLGQSDWNLKPDKVALARSAVLEDPSGAWELHSHPNALVRLRLVDLVDLSQFDWLSWLASESDVRVRDRLRQAVERLYTPSQIVDLLMTDGLAVRREALGWLLVHWKGDVDLKALSRALTAKLGGENKSRLKGKLTRLRQFSR
jgi:hypothetical protein